MRRRKPDDVLTDYVRERLDELVERSPGQDAAEAGLRTVLRPRATLPAGEPERHHHTPDRRSSSESALTEQPGEMPTWWRGLGRERAEGAKEKSGAGVQGAGAVVDPSAWRARFTRQHFVVLGVVLAVGVLIAAFALMRARAVPVDPPVPVAAPAVVEQQSGAPGPETSPTPDPLRVHVVGEVVQPGVHRLVAGARVADAIEAAGGLTDAARPGELNLAQPLADGQQVVIGAAGKPSEVRGAGAGEAAGPGTTSGQQSSGKLNLNAATVAQLDTLPGVGPVTAEKIVAWRTEHGRFTRIEELQEVPGIGPKTFAEIAVHVTV